MYYLYKWCVYPLAFLSLHFFCVQKTYITHINYSINNPDVLFWVLITILSKEITKLRGLESFFEGQNLLPWSTSNHFLTIYTFTWISENLRNYLYLRLHLTTETRNNDNVSNALDNDVFKIVTKCSLHCNLFQFKDDAHIHFLKKCISENTTSGLLLEGSWSYSIENGHVIDNDSLQQPINLMNRCN